jgi:hypothetical protein
MSADEEGQPALDPVALVDEGGRDAAEVRRRAAAGERFGDDLLAQTVDEFLRVRRLRRAPRDDGNQRSVLCVVHARRRDEGHVGFATQQPNEAG